MGSLSSQERRFFDLAFKLAYWIHVNKEIAFFVAEDAMDKLPSVLGSQKKNRKPSEQLRGFFRWGERTRPTRKTVRLNECQTLQWLVFKESGFWEHQTEQGAGPYRPTEEDLIVRYVKHLVFTTLRRDSFYVTLAVGSLLYQFDRRETRLFYDILTQNDSARMKDTNYIGKQRLELLDRISHRFGGMIETTKVRGGEKHLVVRPTTQWVIDLVRECLNRFTPWDTSCVVESDFDVTDIKGLYFSESSPNEDEEDITAMNRIHTVLHPKCLTLLCDGLSRYVNRLPKEDQDRRCNYTSLDERLVIPRFSNLPDAPPRGDRFQIPKLSAEDYIRLARTLEARRHRRNSFVPQQLSTYVNGVLSSSIELKNADQVWLPIGSDAEVIELKGRDDDGELTLATVPLDDDSLGTALNRWVLNIRGYQVRMRLTPAWPVEGITQLATLQLDYSPSVLARLVQVKQRAHHAFAGVGRVGLATVCVLATITIISWVLLWRSFSPQQQKAPEESLREVASNVTAPQLNETKPPPPSKGQLEPLVARSTKQDTLVARASWNTAPDAALYSIPVESTRTQEPIIELSRRRTKIVFSIPKYDNEGHEYLRYRLTLSASKSRLWRDTMLGSKVRTPGSSNFLEILIDTTKTSRTGSLDLYVEGRNSSGWTSIGRVKLRAKA